MRSAAERVRALVRWPVPGRPGRALIRALACLGAVLVVVACSSGQPGSGTNPGSGQNPAGRRGNFPRGRQGFVSFGGGGPGGGVVIFAGPVGLGGGAGRPKITVGPIPPASANRPIPLPLDSYEEVAGLEQNAIAAAAYLLMQRCMSAEGFVFTASPGGTGALSLLQQLEEGYGLASLPQAEQFGYGSPGGSQGPGGPVGPGALILPGLVGRAGSGRHSVAWTAALLGFAPGERLGRQRHLGCFQLAYTELYGSGRGGLGLSVAIGSDPVPGIAGEAASWTQSDPRITAVDSAWSQCMARRGYSYRNPAAAAGKNWPAAPSTVEIATAVADVTCKDQVNLVNTWLAVEAAYQRALISQNLAALASLQSAFRANLSRAQAILDSPPVSPPVSPAASR